jgi:hypothetical protein
VIEQIALIVAIVANTAATLRGYIKLREDVAAVKQDIAWLKQIITTHRGTP